MPPVKTVSHEIFSDRFVLFVVKKNSSGVQFPKIGSPNPIRYQVAVLKR